MAVRIISWIEYVILFLLFLFLLLFFQSYGLLFLVVVWVVFPIFSYAIAKYVKEHTEFSMDTRSKIMGIGGSNEIIIETYPTGKTWFAMGRVLLTIRIGNGFFRERKEIEVEMALRSKGNKISIPVAASFCGNAEIHLVGAKFPSMLSFFQFSKELAVKTEYAVMPELLPIEIPQETSGGLGNEELVEDDVKGNNSSQIRDIDQYKPGDRMQKIHWKASARKDELMVKEYAGTLSNEVTILCELSGEMPVLNEILTMTYSLGVYFVEKIGKIHLKWWNHVLETWSDHEVMSCEELETTMRELFFGEVYEDRTEAVKWLLRQTETYGKIFYINAENELSGLRGTKIEVTRTEQIANAGLMLLEVAD